MKVGLWAFFGLGNLGDEAIQTSAVQNILARSENAEIRFICLDPEAVGKAFNKYAVSIYQGKEPYSPTVAQPQSDKTTRHDSDEQVETTPKHVPAQGGVGQKIRSVVVQLKRLPVLKQLAFALWRVKEEVNHQRTMSQTVKDLDVLVISGSGVLDDSWLGGWKRPFALYRWCLTAKLAGTKLEFHSIGATSIKSRLGTFFGSRALKCADFRSFRDAESHQFSRQNGVVGDDEVKPDLAYGLDLLKFDLTGKSDHEDSVIGFGPIPFLDPRVWPRKDDVLYAQYVGKLTAAISELTSSKSRVRFVVGHTIVDNYTVDDILKSVAELDEPAHDLVENPSILAVPELMKMLATADVVVTSRFHGVLLSYLCGTPVVGLSYNSKIRNLMAYYGQEQFCFDVESFSTEQVLESCNQILANNDEIKSRIVAENNERAKLVSIQYDDFVSRYEKSV